MNNYSWGLNYTQPYLAHYGIKGMHWHERRYQYEDGTYTELGKRRRGDRTPDSQISEDYKRAHSNRDPRTMSTSELQAVNNRHNAEKQYSNLAKGVVATITATVATQLVTETLKNQGSKAIKAGLDSAGKKVGATVKAHPKATVAAVVAATAATAVVVHHNYKKSQQSSKRSAQKLSGADFDGYSVTDRGTF